MRGIRGAFERSWSGAPGAPQWTRLLAPLSLGYGVGSGVARRGAAARRRRIPGVYVIAVGNLTVGGAGKSSVARWLALQAAAAGVGAAVLLRGYGAREAVRGPGVVPDFEGYPLARHVDRYGDEAIAHRLALPREVAVAVDPDRWRAARTVIPGYGARVLVLDDGWEQSGLQWDELWVALDPQRPAGNGGLLPAGPLRRPPATLAEASQIVCLLEEPGEEIPEPTREWVARHGRDVPLLRFRRTLRGVSPLGSPSTAVPLRHAAAAAILSGVGSPRRLERFVRAAGVECRFHAAFPDHARWSESSLREALERARRAGAEEILITEKDEPRWPESFESPIPVRVLRTEIRPLDSMDAAIEPLRAAVASGGGIG